MFERSLQLLNDVLSSTPFGNRYWLRAGLLLGWAREGRILSHDRADADFGFLAQDRDNLLQAIPRLIEAGFAPSTVLRNNAGRATEYVLRRGTANFEFFEMEEVGNELEYFLYCAHGEHKQDPIQIRCRVPRHNLEEIEFVGRRWYKPDRHERQLEVMYGEWRKPDPYHQYINTGAAVERTPWSPRVGWDL